MKFLLKIVQGPNAGAEIALVEGVRVTLGSADSCDIVLADPTLPAEACAIEASADSVALAPFGAEPENLEPLRVRSFGSTALAVGPADSPWGPLNWEAPAAAETAKDAGEKAESPAPPPAAEPAAEAAAKPAAEAAAEPVAAEGSEGKPARSLARRLGGPALLVFLLLLVVCLLARRCMKSESPDGRSPSDPVAADAAAIAERYGLTLVETNGTTLVRGDLATRADRLAATAELYEAQPGIALDLADRETLLSSSADLLQAATEGALQIADVTGRVAVLKGHAPDPAFLSATLDALRTDVPRLSGADTAAVTVASPIAPVAPVAAAAPALAPRPAAPVRQAPRMPLCGILLQPYPCLVLQNGQRLAVGAEVGGYKIERIARDRITLRRGEEEPLEWTP
jgi:type III secretion system YscD/HrpQ family protein